jgi:flagellar motor switch protein FliN/FliY
MSEENPTPDAPVSAETSVATRDEAPGRRIEATSATRATASGELDFVLDVPLQVEVRIGETRMRVGEVLQLDKGSVIELDRMAGDPVDVLVNGRLIARGEVTTVGDRIAVRLLELANRADASADAG